MQVTSENCYNSSDLQFDLVFTTEALTSGASSRKFSSALYRPEVLPFIVLASMAMLLL